MKSLWNRRETKASRQKAGWPKDPKAKNASRRAMEPDPEARHAMFDDTGIQMKIMANGGWMVINGGYMYS